MCLPREGHDLNNSAWTSPSCLLSPWRTTHDEDFTSTGALHYYGKLGYDEDSARALHELIKRYNTFAAAWNSLSVPGYLSLPERIDSDGWHGFIIQTFDYQALSDRLGQFVHHATTEAAQDDAVTVTFAAMVEVFGLLSPEL